MSIHFRIDDALFLRDNGRMEDDFLSALMALQPPSAVLALPSGSSLCVLCVCVSVVSVLAKIVNHRGTEDTEVAQRDLKAQ